MKLNQYGKEHRDDSSTIPSNIHTKKKLLLKSVKEEKYIEKRVTIPSSVFFFSLNLFVFILCDYLCSFFLKRTEGDRKNHRSCHFFRWNKRTEHTIWSFEHIFIHPYKRRAKKIKNNAHYTNISNGQKKAKQKRIDCCEASIVRCCFFFMSSSFLSHSRKFPAEMVRPRQKEIAKMLRNSTKSLSTSLFNHWAHRIVFSCFRVIFLFLLFLSVERKLEFRYKITQLHFSTLQEGTCKEKKNFSILCVCVFVFFLIRFDYICVRDVVLSLPPWWPLQ